MHKISLLAAALTAATLTLTACGGGSGKSASSPSANANDKAVKFAQCMRQHGVPMADPTDGRITINNTAGPAGQSKMDAAQQACKQYSPIGNGATQSAQDRDRQLKMAECMRRHGVNVPDPKPGQQGMLMTSGPQDQGKMQEALKACQQKNGS